MTLLYLLPPDAAARVAAVPDTDALPSFSPSAVAPAAAVHNAAAFSDADHSTAPPPLSADVALAAAVPEANDSAIANH